jgi:hypothetical protein
MSSAPCGNTRARQTATPVYRRPSTTVFELGPSRDGLWVLRQGSGCALFRDRVAAERYAAIDAGGLPNAVIRRLPALEPDFGPKAGDPCPPGAYQEPSLIRSLLGFTATFASILLATLSLVAAAGG